MSNEAITAVHGEVAGTRESPPDQRAKSWRFWIPLIALGAYLLTMCTSDSWLPTEPAGSIWELQDRLQLAEWLANVAWSRFLYLLQFVPVGFLAWMILVESGWPALPGQHGLLARCRRFLIQVSAALVAGVAMVAIVGGLQARQSPPRLLLVLPCFAYLLGAWMSWHWCRGARACFWFVVQVVVGAVLAGSGIVALLWMAVDDQPLPFAPVTMNSYEKQRVVDHLRAGLHHDGDVHRWHLSEAEVNFLVASGLSLSTPDGKARMRFTAKASTCEISLGVPWPVNGLYLNLRIVANGTVHDGKIQLRWEQVQVGRVAVPRWIVAWLAPLLLDLLAQDPDGKQILASIVELRTEHGAMRIAVQRGKFSSRIVPSLLSRLGAKPDVRAATKEHLWHLASASHHFPRGDARFSAFLQSAFRFAHDRSRDGGAAAENRAAIYSIAILIGHHKIERFVGPVTTAEFWETVPRDGAVVTIRGRADWTQHFWVSAALASLSSEAASNAVGQLKEELDSAHGSGFSFSDLLADRAGTLFGLAATRDDESARWVQNRVVDTISLDDLFPHAADLPEGIPATELARVYGGVNGPRYRELAAEIERRLGNCSLLRAPDALPR